MGLRGAAVAGGPPTLCRAADERASSGRRGRGASRSTSPQCRPAESPGHSFPPPRCGRSRACLAHVAPKRLDRRPVLDLRAIVALHEAVGGGRRSRTAGGSGLAAAGGALPPPGHQHWPRRRRKCSLTAKAPHECPRQRPELPEAMRRKAKETPSIGRVRALRGCRRLVREAEAMRRACEQLQEKGRRKILGCVDGFRSPKETPRPGREIGASNRTKSGFGFDDISPFA